MLTIYICLPRRSWNYYLDKFYCCYLHRLKFRSLIPSPHHGISGHMLFVVSERFVLSDFTIKHSHLLNAFPGTCCPCEL